MLSSLYHSLLLCTLLAPSLASSLLSQQQTHKEGQLLPLPRTKIRSLWMSACDTSQQKSPLCCPSWNQLVLKAEAQLHSFWNPDKNLSTTDVTLFDEYEPHWNCASRERMPSKAGDGPKWVCGMDTLNDSALVYSFGSNGDTQFEDGMREKLHTPNIYIFDPTLNKNQKASVLKKSHHLIESGLTKNNMNSFPARGTKFRAQSLPMHMAQLGHSSRYLDVLKIDVESSEYISFMGLVIGDCASATVKVGQVQIELHHPHNVLTPDLTIKRLFHSLYSCGMLLFSKEGNHWGCGGYRCVEFSFLSPSLAFADFKSVNPTCV